MSTKIVFMTDDEFHCQTFSEDEKYILFDKDSHWITGVEDIDDVNLLLKTLVGGMQEIALPNSEIIKNLIIFDIQNEIKGRIFFKDSKYFIVWETEGCEQVEGQTFH